jgi:HAMP domain-containing protein
MDYLRLIENAREKSSAQGTAILDGDAYHTFTVPIRAPVAIAWVVVGFRIDSQLAQRISGLTGLEVSIVSTSRDNAGTIATTRHGDIRTGVDLVLADPTRPLNTIYMIDEEGLGSLTLSTPFVHTGNDVLVVLERSIQEAMTPYTEARKGLFIFAAVLLAFVAAVAAWFSGSVASPLRILTVAARRMISGNYDMKIVVRTTDEFGELASSFNAMRTAIADREKRISHQALHDPLTDLPNRAMVMQRLTGAALAHERDLIDPGPRCE